MKIYDLLRSSLARTKRQREWRAWLWSPSLWERSKYITYRSRGFAIRSASHGVRDFFEVVAMSAIGSLSLGWLAAASVAVHVALGSLLEAMGVSIRNRWLETHQFKIKFQVCLAVLAIGLGYGWLAWLAVAHLGLKKLLFLLLVPKVVHTALMFASQLATLKITLRQRVYVSPWLAPICSLYAVVGSLASIELLGGKRALVALVVVQSSSKIFEQLWVWRQVAMAEAKEAPRENPRIHRQMHWSQDVARMLAVSVKFWIPLLLIQLCLISEARLQVAMAIMFAAWLAKTLERPISAIAVDIVGSLEKGQSLAVLNWVRDSLRISLRLGLVATAAIGIFWFKWSLPVAAVMWIVSHSGVRLVISRQIALGLDELIWKRLILGGAFGVVMLLGASQNSRHVDDLFWGASVGEVLLLVSLVVGLAKKNLAAHLGFKYAQELGPTVERFYRMSAAAGNWLSEQGLSDRLKFARLQLGRPIEAEKLLIKVLMRIESRLEGQGVVTSLNRREIAVWMPGLRLEEQVIRLKAIQMDLATLIIGWRWEILPVGSHQDSVALDHANWCGYLQTRLEDQFKESQARWWSLGQDGYWRCGELVANAALQRDLNSWSSRHELSARNQVLPSSSKSPYQALTLRPFGETLAILVAPSFGPELRAHFDQATQWTRERLGGAANLNREVAYVDALELGRSLQSLLAPLGAKVVRGRYENPVIISKGLRGESLGLLIVPEGVPLSLDPNYQKAG